MIDSSYQWQSKGQSIQLVSSIFSPEVDESQASGNKYCPQELNPVTLELVTSINKYLRR